MYAIIEDSGQQFRIREGDELDVDLRELTEKTKKIEFDKVLLIADDGKTTVGTPLIAGAKIVAEIIEPEVKGPKLHIYRWRRRKASRTKTGHRQKYTRVRISKIAPPKSRATASAKPKPVKKKTAKKSTSPEK